jgi:uncharacterized protein (TIGR03435 family)
MRRFIATVTSFVIWTAAILFAQAQPDAPPRFQTVSIKPSVNGNIRIDFQYRSFTAPANTLVELIEAAYDVKDYEVFGGPGWVRTDRFAVHATTPYVGIARMKQMLQTLLAERFRLQLERETVTTTIYRLRGGTVGRLTPHPYPDPRVPIGLTRDDYDANQRWDARSVTMGRFAEHISRYLGAPVVDETGLTGAFDFRVTFSQDDALARQTSNPNSGTLFNAIEKQLGLSLAAETGPVPGYVIRRATKP